MPPTFSLDKVGCLVRVNWFVYVVVVAVLEVRMRLLYLCIGAGIGSVCSLLVVAAVVVVSSLLVRYSLI